MTEPIQSLKSEVAFTPERYVRCSSAGVLRTQKGFTLIELMIVVAVIGVLATIAIVFFGGTQRKGKAKAEVSAMFAEFQVKQEQFFLENNSYADCGGVNTEGNMFPATPASNGNKTDITGGFPAQWTTMGVNPGRPALYCSYTCVHGAAGVDTVGPIAKAQFGFGNASSPVPAADPWFYVLAHCNMDTDTSVDSYYFQYSGDTELYFTNQGR